MHQLNVLFLGSDSFKSTLNELKFNLKFKLSFDSSNLDVNTISKYHVLFIHREILENMKIREIITNSNAVKILVTDKNEKNIIYDDILKLPTSIKEINYVIEKSVAKKTFNKNSSIKIKSFLLDKNEKKLIKDNKSIILTEKEVQLLELLVQNKKPISKNKILNLIWHYSSDADTHTVETHIYRLRKKINDKFMFDKFILNNKDGYYF
jgi:DNA-binding response OmpR family regulator